MNPEKKLHNKYIVLIVVWFTLASLLTLGKLGVANHLGNEATPTPAVSQQRYETLKKQYLLIVKTEGPASAVDKLKLESEKDPVRLYYCHDLMHEIGKASLLQLKDFSKAAALQDATCVSGYIHGVLQEYFSSTKDVYSAMSVVCDDHKVEDFSAWECYHGVGHGLMYYSENDLPKSIERCSTYPGLFTSSACANGVYMENFTADEESHPTIYRKTHDPFYPCAEQKEEYKAGCYQNAPIYYLSLRGNDYKSALQWCRNAEDDFRHNCYSGVGSQAARRNIQNIKQVESVCTVGDTQQKNWCFVGIVNYYIGHYGSIDKAASLCDKFEKRNQEICKDAISLHAQMF